MNTMRALVLVALVSSCGLARADEAAAPSHYVFFNLDRQRITEADFLDNAAIAGAQLKYTWKELEPAQNRYDFSDIHQRLEFLREHGKGLFLQIQDVSFDERVLVPDYLTQDSAFGGGVARKYEFENDDESKPVFDGWVARRWDSAVIERFTQLLHALGKEFDGRIEGINLAETSIGFGESEPYRPAGYSHEAYVRGVQTIMSAAAEAFPRSHVLQYANFMPGEWLPWEDKGYLESIYRHAEAIGVGVGGPDLMPHRRGQRNHCLKFIATRGENVVAGLAVQWGNLDEIHPQTGKPVTPAELLAFARNELHLDYIFWGTQEPHYSGAVLPWLQTLAERSDRSSAP